MLEKKLFNLAVSLSFFCHISMSFTKETEQWNKIPFLAVNVTGE